MINPSSKLVFSHVPTLRFQGYSEDWKTYKLGEVAQFRRGSFPQPYGLPEWYDDENGVPFVQVYDVGFNMKLKDKTKQKISELAKDNSVFVKKGSIVLTIQGSIGRIAMTQYDSYVDRTLLIFQSFSIPLDKTFLMYVVFMLFQIEKEKAPGGTIKTITKERLAQFMLHIPSLSEQQRIASLFTRLDSWLENLRSQKTALEAYKKSIMQKILSQEIRFKDENDKEYPKWEEKTIEEISENNTSNLSADSLKNNNGEYPVYGASGLFKRVDFFNQSKPYISIVKDGAGVGRVLMCESKSSVLGTLNIIKPKSDTNLYFLYQLMKNINFKKYTKGSTIPHIYYKDYKKEKIQIPSLFEQEKIANYLTLIDKIAESIGIQILQTELWKKGLMQKMFV